MESGPSECCYWGVFTVVETLKRRRGTAERPTKAGRAATKQWRKHQNWFYLKVWSALKIAG